MRFKLLFLVSFVCCITAMGQIGMANHYPTMHVLHILDDADLNEDIAFAYSLRLLRTDYIGPLIRLRRDSDDNEQDFYAGDNDILDVDAVSSWAGTNTVFVKTVYDQSNEARNVVQNTNNRQPQLDFSDPIMPYWVGDGANDILVVNGTMGDLLDDNAKASVLGVMYSTVDKGRAFGVNNATGTDRWSAHINWFAGTNSTINPRAVFDPGCQCGGTRQFINTKFTWDQYTFIRRADLGLPDDDRRVARYNGVQMLNSTILTADKLTVANTYPMGICAVSRNNTGTSAFRSSNTRFSELIMYKTGKSDAFVQEIENNQITFWNL